MRVLKSIVVCWALFGSSAMMGTLESQAQVPTISGPVLGFTPDHAGSAITPIMGVPGASIMGGPLDLNTGISGVLISPRQDYGIAIRVDDGLPVVVDLASNPGHIAEIPGANGADLIAISPTGSTLALYEAASNTVQIVSRVAKTPRVIHELDTSAIPGSLTTIEVSDGGSVVLARAGDSDSNSLWTITTSGAVSLISVDRPSAAAFFPNRTDAIITDDATGSALIVKDAGRAATQVPLVSGIEGMTGFSSIAASEDGQTVFLADAGSGNVAVVDVQTGNAVTLPCHCKPSGFYHLKGTSIYRLTDPSNEPMVVLDASGAAPRIVVIPPFVPAGSGSIQ